MWRDLQRFTDTTSDSDVKRVDEASRRGRSPLRKEIADGPTSPTR